LVPATLCLAHTCDILSVLWRRGVESCQYLIHLYHQRLNRQPPLTHSSVAVLCCLVWVVMIFQLIKIYIFDRIKKSRN
jgi:hypothetical protein